MGNSSVTKDYDALCKDMKSLRADVSALAQSVAAGGKQRAQAVGDSALEQARRRLQQITDRSEAAYQRGREVVDTVERRVAEHPGKSLGIVFGTGVFVGLLLRWLLRSSRS